MTAGASGTLVPMWIIVLAAAIVGCAHNRAGTSATAQGAGPGMSAATTAQQRALLLSGGIDAEGTPHLDPAFVLDAPPGDPARPRNRTDPADHARPAARASGAGGSRGAGGGNGIRALLQPRDPRPGGLAAFDSLGQCFLRLPSRRAQRYQPTHCIEPEWRSETNCSCSHRPAY